MSDWTPGRKKAFIIAALRKATARYPEKYECLAEACVGVKVNQKTGREAKHYLCSTCCGEFTSKDVEVDHITPVVSPQQGFTTWDEYIERLFCDKDNFQVLCKPCHSLKTKEEKQWKLKK